MANKIPNCTKPCKGCPFRKDTQEGWLGENRMSEILNQGSFTCHKTDKTLQCAGHMIMKGDSNIFVRTAKRLKVPLRLEGEELVFDNEESCINHHSNNW